MSLTPGPDPKARPVGADVCPSSLDAMLAMLQRDSPEHVAGGPSDSEELRRVEETLGCRLPVAFRRFLETIGGGLFYQRHEIFGTHRVIIHDIELVPDILTFRRTIQGNVSAGTVPFHRTGTTVHVFDLEAGIGAALIHSLDGSRSYPDFVTFLERVVLPPGRPTVDD